MLNSAATGTARLDHSNAWWSAGMGPHEQGRPMPAWAEYVERSTATAVTPPPVTGDWQQALVRCLEPLLATARQDLATAGQTGVLTDQFLHRLGLRLVRLASRTLVLELARARDRGELAGETPAERFLDFTHRLEGGSELAEFLAAYPVLARVLGEACRQAVEGHLELLARLAEDREQIVTELLAGTDPGPLVSIETSGDPHRGGRATAMLTFTDGQQVVYKPRPLDLHQHFNDLVAWMNDKSGIGLQTVRVLRKPGYGWLEFIRHTSCTDLAEVRRFYHRQGALLALLYVLDGTDMHHENLIAHGDQPVLVDVETLFHPSQSLSGLPSEDPAYAALHRSVYRTALLPLLMTGEHGVVDISGLGGDSGELSPNNSIDWDDAGLDTMHLVRRPHRTRASQNRPHLDGAAMEPREHDLALLAGFRAAYEAIAWNRSELLGPDGLLTDFYDDEMRYVPRATQAYASLLDESTHPDALRDSAGRSQLLDMLWEADPTLRRLVPAELSDLWAGDIPLFSARPNSLDAWASDGTRVAKFFAHTGLAAVETKVEKLSEVDLHRQQWLISATLATRPEPIVHACSTIRSSLETAEADPEQLLAAATNIADEIMARAEDGADGWANWLGLDLLDDHHWLVMPMGAGLTNGYTGVALFLAQIGALTGASKYTELAKDAIRPLPRLLDTLITHKEAAQTVGPGLYGMGGISYGLHRLQSLLNEQELGDWLATSLEITTGLVREADLFPSYSEGAAGGLAAMQAIQHHPLAAALAARYADELVEIVDRGVRREGAEPLDGFARGYQGIAWSLGQYGVPGDKYRDAALAAADLGQHSGVANPGWCSGGAGSTLARLRAGAPTDIEPYLKSTSERPVLADMSLCHGELGAVEPLLWLDERDHPAIEAVRRRRAGLVLAAVQQYGPQCGTPRGVSSPGLLTGLAGIGYGLLRLGFTRRVPSILLLEPITGA
ncbi:type 2 lanthipeptide synthetase LanM family protein [Kribbella sp. CA-293567]|uniref:type 2 lanthipeptide synthetase LanM family protein n=1 Tax=Kribbella sp. CA-293567 TaxID=3002436 RepID=UPI0022DE6F24|nr:type 2 lanthipeptide synthetase LanM family protein [Kribbella sp. CA-293567]WBQ06035.1 type 2 lanthipeptide synthetase LanM family protein [Kribbella sp. CA-293567]